MCQLDIKKEEAGENEEGFDSFLKNSDQRENGTESS